MIDIEVISNKIRTECVGIAVVSTVLSYSIPKSTPAVFIYLLNIEARENKYVGDHKQYMTSEIGIDILIRNVNQSDIGISASQDFSRIREDVFSKIKGWEMSDYYTPFDFLRGELINYNNGLLIWRDHFTTTNYRN